MNGRTERYGCWADGIASAILAAVKYCDRANKNCHKTLFLDLSPVLLSLYLSLPFFICYWDCAQRKWIEKYLELYNCAPCFTSSGHFFRSVVSSIVICWSCTSALRIICLKLWWNYNVFGRRCPPSMVLDHKMKRKTCTKMNASCHICSAAFGHIFNYPLRNSSCDASFVIIFRWAFSLKMSVNFATLRYHRWEQSEGARN